MIPVIVCSCHIIGLAVIRALGEKGVPVIAVSYDKKDMAHCSKYVSKVVRTPHPSTDESAFVDALEKSLDYLSDGVLMPVDDATLCAVSRHRHRFDRKFKVSCGGWDMVSRYIDKHQTYTIAEKYGIAAPQSRYIKNAAEAGRSAEEFKFPLLVKPCQSHLYFERFKTKMVLVQTLEDLLREYERAAQAGLDMVIQEFIPGDDTHGVNYNSFVVDGKPVVEFTAEKIRLSPPNFGIPSAVRSKHIPEIIEPGRAIVKALGFQGYSCTEFKKDPRDGSYKLMEVNGRHNRSARLALSMGINFPWIEYQYLSRGRFDSTNVKNDVGEHVWIDEFKDMATYAIPVLKGSYPLRSFLQPYRARPTFAVFDRRDIRPFIKRLGDSFSKIRENSSS